MRIGAVVVSHNSAEDLQLCIEALLRADGLERIVVVDNASEDESRELVRAFDDPRVSLVLEEPNSGFAGGCNRGFREIGAQCDHLAFLNPDVVIASDCLAEAVAALEAAPTLACVAPLLMRSDGQTVDTVGQRLNPWNLEVKDLGYGRPPTPDLLRPTDVLSACGALAVFRSEALQSVAEEHGPWAQHFFCFWEDLELGWRLSNAGWRVRSCPTAVGTHRRGAGAAEGVGPLRWRRPPTLEAHILSNRWMTLIRHLRPLDLLMRLPLLLMWDSSVTAAGVMRRPSLLGHLRRRWPMVMRELRRPKKPGRRRLHELP